MDKEQDEIVAAVKQMANMVTLGQLRGEEIPFTDIQELLKYSFKYGDDRYSESLIAAFMDLLRTEVAGQDKNKCGQFLDLMSECMKSNFVMKDYYQKRETDIIQSARQMLYNHNGIYEEIVKHYNENQIDAGFLETHTYESLAIIKEEKGEIELFEKIAGKVFESAIQLIRKKETVKIAFFLKDSAEWSCEEIYHRFQQNERFKLSIVVAPFQVGTPKTIADTYAQTAKYFKDKGYDVTELYDVFQNRYKSWKEIGVPDIIFHLNPHYSAFLETANIRNMPLSALHVYIPYGIMTYGNVEHQFNQLSHHLYWKIFCESMLHQQMAAKYSDIGDTNVVYSGYAKMDAFWETKPEQNSCLWKIAEEQNENEVKKIIYAPHYSMKDAFAGFGSFDKLYMDMYQYAKSHVKTTSWIFRPHPMLRAASVQQGLFHSEAQYDAYLQLWRELPNARVSEEGTYSDVFLTSDAMILDSVSFMSEYLYVHKPMLFLTRERQTFNDFGEKLKEVLYTVSGDDWQGIVDFLEKVVFERKDCMKEQREKFFVEYLDYKEKNGMLASDYIYKYILQQIQKEG